MTILFETPRLIIREFEPSDFPGIHDYAQQAEVVQYQIWGPNTEVQTQEFLDQAIQNQTEHPRLNFEFCVLLKNSNLHIGGCGIHLKDQNYDLAHIGYIMNPAFWGKGYATEVTKGLINYTRQILNIKNIKATCDQQNIASKRVLEKSGFQLEKIIEKDFLQKGKWRTTLLFDYSN
jgi:RimJ/RimL family protein N-acetyltransferase